MRRRLFAVLSCLYLTLIFAVPGAMATAPFWILPSNVGRGVALALAPTVFLFTLPFVAGVLAASHRRFLREGKFARDVGDRDYFHRRLYGLCWTTVYYAQPVMLIITSLPWMQHAVLRLFGYAGETKFSVYPDTWIRDLPLLDIGPGAYLSNRATIGTNIVMQNGRILVGKITIGAGAIVGHLCMLGPGVVVGKTAEIAVGTAIGPGSRIGDGAYVGPECAIEHAVTIGAGAWIGVRTFIGSGSSIGPGVQIPPCSIIPARSHIRSVADLPTRAAPVHLAAMV